MSNHNPSEKDDSERRRETHLNVALALLAKAKREPSHAHLEGEVSFAVALHLTDAESARFAGLGDEAVHTLTLYTVTCKHGDGEHPDEDVHQLVQVNTAFSLSPKEKVRLPTAVFHTLSQAQNAHLVADVHWVKNPVLRMEEYATVEIGLGFMLHPDRDSDATSEPFWCERISVYSRRIVEIAGDPLEGFDASAGLVAYAADASRFTSVTVYHLVNDAGVQHTGLELGTDGPLLQQHPELAWPGVSTVERVHVICHLFGGPASVEAGTDVGLFMGGIGLLLERVEEAPTT